MDEALEEQRRMVAQNERAVKAAEDNVNAVKEAFYTGERAYMGIMALEIGDLVQDEVVTLAILWQNGGKTPAWNFRCLPSLVLSEDEPKGEMYFADDDFSDISGSFWPAQTMRQIQYP